LNFWHDLKKWNFDVHIDIFDSLAANHPADPPPSWFYILLLQTTWAQEKSREAVVHSPARCQLGFQSVYGPRPCIVWGKAGLQSGGGGSLSFFLSALMVMHQSGQVPKIDLSI
jgi:hypothetical protein